MATASRAIDFDVAGRALQTRLEEEPFCFEFFQAVRLLQRLAPDRPVVGHFAAVKEEPVRFGVHVTAAFPASEIQSLEWRDGVARMKVNFMGLIGPLGVLPLNYTALAAEHQRVGDRTLIDFLDLFHHRILSLFYRAWEKQRFFAAYERGARDAVTLGLLDFIGLGTSGLQQRQSVPDDALLYYSGLLGQRPRSAGALRQLISDYFDVPVEIEQFTGAWYQLDETDQCCLDDRATPSEILGLGAVVGDEVWVRQSGVRVCIGPVPLQRYCQFLPDGSAYAELCDLIRFFSNDEFDFQVKLILTRDEVPRCELAPEDSNGQRLGWTTWVKTQSMQRDPGDTIISIAAQT